MNLRMVMSLWQHVWLYGRGYNHHNYRYCLEMRWNPRDIQDIPGMTEVSFGLPINRMIVPNLLLSHVKIKKLTWLALFSLWLHTSYILAINENKEFKTNSVNSSSSVLLSLLQERKYHVIEKSNFHKFSK